MQVIQTTAAAQADAEPFRDRPVHHPPPEPAEGSSWPARWPTGSSTPALNPACCAASRAGDPRSEGRRPALAKGGKAPSYGVRVSFQRLGRRQRRPALGQQPKGMPPLPFPGLGARISRLLRPDTSIFPSSRNRLVSPRPKTAPTSSRFVAYATPSDFIGRLCRFHLGFGSGAVNLDGATRVYRPGYERIVSGQVGYSRTGRNN